MFSWLLIKKLHLLYIDISLLVHRKLPVKFSKIRHWHQRKAPDSLSASQKGLAYCNCYKIYECPFVYLFKRQFLSLLRNARLLPRQKTLCCRIETRAQYSYHKFKCESFHLETTFYTLKMLRSGRTNKTVLSQQHLPERAVLVGLVWQWTYPLS